MSTISATVGRFLGVRPRSGVINLKNQVNEYFGKHRSGWAFVVECMSPAHHPQGIYLNTFVEKTFVWEPKSATPIKEPWIGVIHIPPYVPDWFMAYQSNDAMFATKAWQKSQPYCRGLFTLSEYHKTNLETKLSIPIDTLLHPTGEPRLNWTWEAFQENTNKCIIQVGWWLRVLHAIFELPECGFEKIFLRVYDEPFFYELLEKEREVRQKRGLFRDSMYETARIVSYMSALEYDELLSKNIVFLNLYDASANNAIIECISRNTPVFVNPLPAVIEYLGEDYPLYYLSLDEAAEKANDMSLIYSAHEYIKALPIKNRLTGEHLLATLLNSRLLG